MGLSGSTSRCLLSVYLLSVRWVSWDDCLIYLNRGLSFTQWCPHCSYKHKNIWICMNVKWQIAPQDILFNESNKTKLPEMFKGKTFCWGQGARDSIFFRVLDYYQKEATTLWHFLETIRVLIRMEGVGVSARHWGFQIWQRISWKEAIWLLLERAGSTR